MSIKSKFVKYLLFSTFIISIHVTLFAQLYLPAVYKIPFWIPYSAIKCISSSKSSSLTPAIFNFASLDNPGGFVFSSFCSPHPCPSTHVGFPYHQLSLKLPPLPSQALPPTTTSPPRIIATFKVGKIFINYLVVSQLTLAYYY